MTTDPTLEPALASWMATTAIANIGREYPNAPSLLVRSAADLRTPREVHPAFFGSYDWHSCVHQHWLLVRLLRMGVLEAEEGPARETLGRSLTPANLQAEAAYLRDHPAFERTYGWAWLLALVDEVEVSGEADAAAWSTALRPARDVVVELWIAYLSTVTYPIRSGAHANSAFGLALALDHARRAGDTRFEAVITARVEDWFGADRDYPAWLEPGGEDFLSGALMEAALMTRVRSHEAFAAWFRAFLPDPPPAVLVPAVVADRTDPRIVHLDGLNLSRAWCWRTIAAALGTGALAIAASRAADVHLGAAIPHLASGAYVGEHWVASFALLALTDG